MYLQLANLQSGRHPYAENDYKPCVIPTHVEDNTRPRGQKRRGQ